MLDSCHHPLESESRSDFINIILCVCMCRTVFYGQYQCSGAGAAVNKRVPWSREFTDRTQIEQYLSTSYIGGDKWIKQ